MAWQLHYTSAEAGPSGRAGFQITAETPGVPAGLTSQVTPYLTYRPPPSMPTAPTPDQIRAMPVALSYGLIGHRFALARCVYLGQDYSGRYGNFLGHALILGEDDLVGLRPIELWRAPLWADAPVRPGTELPELANPMPGTALDPESLGQWLRSKGPDAYQRLGILLELTRRSLTQGHGRLVLVSEDGDEIVRWIAVISYSLPWEAVTRLSFVTYSGDPASTAQLIVGTTPDVWIPSDVDATVVTLTGEPQPIETGRFSDTMRELWRSMDLGGIDELSAFDADDPDTAAALVALCLTGTELSEAEQSAIVELVGGDLPEWVWPLLGQRAELLGYPLAAAVAAHGPAEASGPCAARCVLLALRDPGLAPPRGPLPDSYRGQMTVAARAELDAADRLPHLVGILRVADTTGLELPARQVERAAATLVRSGLIGVAEQLDRTPSGGREALLAGLVSGLERALPQVRAEVLTAELCRSLADRDLRSAPATSTVVIAWQVESGRLGRVDATARLLALAHPPQALAERETTLAGLWREDPTTAECRRVIEAAGARIQSSPTLSSLPARLFVRVGLKGHDAADIAGQVRDARLPGSAARDAEAVLMATGLASMSTPGHAAGAVDRLTDLLRHGDPGLTGVVLAWAAKALARQDVMFRMALLRKLSGPSLGWLLDAWLGGRANRDEQAALLEIAIRLRRSGLVIAPLEEWAQALVNSWSPFGSMESRFKHDRDLSAGLRELMKPRRRGILRRGGS
ncbi:GAP1-N2 domain-containing protein [Streptosporangium sp. NPDC004631]